MAKITHGTKPNFHTVYCGIVALFGLFDICFLVRPGVCSYPTLGYFKATLSACITLAAIIEAIQQSITHTNDTAVILRWSLIGGCGLIFVASMVLQRWAYVKRKLERSKKASETVSLMAASAAGTNAAVVAVQAIARLNAYKRSKSQTSVMVQQTQVIRKKLLRPLSSFKNVFSRIAAPVAPVPSVQIDIMQSVEEWYTSVPLVLESHRGMWLTTKQRKVRVAVRSCTFYFHHHFHLQRFFFWSSF